MFSKFIRFQSVLGLLVIFFLSSSRLAWAVRPLSHTLSLVAGGGNEGFQDGPFTSALFKKPFGLGINPEGTQLFVADSGNNRIRVVHLDQDNAVSTLTGMDLAGNKNGPLAAATFNNPMAVLYLSNDRLVINDCGNEELRLVDLKKGIVSSLAGNINAVLAEGPASQVSMESVHDMVYLPDSDSIVFAQTQQQAVKILDLKTGQVRFILHNDPLLPTPVALCRADGKLYVADRDRVFNLEWKVGEAPKLTLIATLTSNIQFLKKSGDCLYALCLNEETPLMRVLPRVEPVSFVSSFGDVIPSPEKNLPPFHSENNSINFIPDPIDSTKLYIVNPTYNLIASFRDLPDEVKWFGWRNPEGINEAEYPVQKPLRTFRILLCGDSHSCAIANYPFPMSWNDKMQEKDVVPPRALSLCKRMELELNTLAALDDWPLHFEVLNLYQNANNPPLFLWPTYEVPEVVRKFDIDLVLLLETPSVGGMDYIPFVWYFYQPITAEGIPALNIDAEYFLKPLLKKIPDGDPRNFYEICKDRKLVTDNGKYFFFEPKLFAVPELHDLLVRLYGKPLELLDKKLANCKTSSGKPVQLLLCTAHTGLYKLNPDTLEDPKIWADASQKLGVSYLDLNEEITALNLSFYPLAENNTNGHLDPDGHLFLSQLLVHDLVRDGYIPESKPSSATPVSSGK